MRLRFYVAAVVVIIVSAFLVDQLLGKLYVRYMILFSGAIFLWGMLVGQRSEQAWIQRRSARASSVPRRIRPVSSSQEVGR